ncbi:hypothetical protein PPYR_15062, partial [Photinus pyralis]
MFMCNICRKEYVSKKSLSRHTKLKHEMEYHAKHTNYQCMHCNVSFQNKSNIIIHLKSHREVTERHGRLLCPFQQCNHEIIRNYANLNKHLVEKHNYEAKEEVYEFVEDYEFDTWKANMESNTNASYVLDTCEKKLKNGLRQYLNCHRSFNFSMKQSRKRSIKHIGSNKIGFACPSRMVVTKTFQKILVTFYPNHCGHECEMGRLRLQQNDRSTLA